jgi:hypothetical protein
MNKVISLNTTNPISGSQDGLLNVTVPSSSGARPYIGFISVSQILSGNTIRLSFDYKVNSGSPILNNIFNAK